MVQTYSAWPRLRLCAPLVPGLTSFDLDLTLRTNEHLLVSGLASSLVLCNPGPSSKTVEKDKSWHYLILIPDPTQYKCTILWMVSIVVMMGAWEHNVHTLLKILPKHLLHHGFWVKLGIVDKVWLNLYAVPDENQSWLMIQGMWCTLLLLIWHTSMNSQCQAMICMQAFQQWDCIWFEIQCLW